MRLLDRCGVTGDKNNGEAVTWHRLPSIEFHVDLAPGVPSLMQII